MKDIAKRPFELEAAAENVKELSSAIQLTADKKADAMITCMEVFHTNIVSWTTRSYDAATWALGAEYVAVSYFYVRDTKLDLPSASIVGLGLLVFGGMTQFYLRAASRAHAGNRLAISKCEAALHLYLPESYLVGRAFFTYSKKMLISTNLAVLRWLHGIGTAVAILLLFLVHLLK